MGSQIDRRQRRLLLQGLAAGALLPGRLSVAAVDDKADAPRFVVVMLRGALDGLAAVPALGDPDWQRLRGDEAVAPNTPNGGKPLALDAMFGLHPALAELHRWYGAKELLVVHATASPYRERSHFDAQQQLESGGERPFALATGWLGRALQASGKPAVALTPAMPVALRGADQASTWTPSGKAATASASEDLYARVAQLYRADARLGNAWSQALTQQGMARDVGMDGTAGAGFTALARQAGGFLAAEQGPRVAWLEAGGWDTHAQQAGRLLRLLSGLDEGLAALKTALGPHWRRTTVLVMTEFGRSAVLNGTGGTDHGTGGVAFLAGGAVAGGRIVVDWPGLAPARLHEGRDLRPTLDLRLVIAGALQQQFGLGRAQLEAGVLPGAGGSEKLALWRA